MSALIGDENFSLIVIERGRIIHWQGRRARSLPAIKLNLIKIKNENAAPRRPSKADDNFKFSHEWFSRGSEINNLIFWKVFNPFSRGFESHFEFKPLKWILIQFNGEWARNFKWFFHHRLLAGEVNRVTLSSERKYLPLPPWGRFSLPQESSPNHFWSTQQARNSHKKFNFKDSSCVAKILSTMKLNSLNIIHRRNFQLLGRRKTFFMTFSLPLAPP